jgi:DNA-binding NtrC family response regulator
MAKVLIIEDYENLQTIYGSVVKKAGHDVTVVNDGLVALEKIEKTKYDVILLDLLLPHMSGMEFLNHFQPSQHPETRVIICSNFSSAELKMQAEKLGILHFLVKANFTPAEIVEIIERALKEPT